MMYPPQYWSLINGVIVSGDDRKNCLNVILNSTHFDAVHLDTGEGKHSREKNENENN